MRKIQIGIVGAGAVSKHHIRGYQLSEYAEVVAIADIDKNKAEERSKNLVISSDGTSTLKSVATNIPNIYVDYKEMIQSEDLDAVSICLPNNLHEDATIYAAEHGYHVLCEKPMTTSVDSADRMIETCKNNNVKLMIEFPLRFNPAMVKIKELLSNNVIGKVFSVRTKWGHSGPENWSPTGKWFFEKRKSGGGALLDLAVHNIDALRWMIGEVKCVSSLVRTLVKNIDVDDNSASLFEFKNGAIGVVEASWSNIPDINAFEICGSKGRIIYGYPNTEFEVYINNDLMQGTFKPEIKKHQVNDLNDGHILCVRYFVDRIVKDKEIELASGLDGKKAIEIISAIYKSSMENKTIFLK